MICFYCHKPIRGADVANRFEWRQEPPRMPLEGPLAGTIVPQPVRIYGNGAPDGTLREAKGQLVLLSHHKCYHAWKKQQELADARAADAPTQPVPEQDWRHQEVHDVEDLVGNEGHGDH